MLSLNKPADHDVTMSEQRSWPSVYSLPSQTVLMGPFSCLTELECASAGWCDGASRSDRPGPLSDAHICGVWALDMHEVMTDCLLRPLTCMTEWPSSSTQRDFIITGRMEGIKEGYKIPQLPPPLRSRAAHSRSPCQPEGYMSPQWVFRCGMNCRNLLVKVSWMLTQAQYHSASALSAGTVTAA